MEENTNPLDLFPTVGPTTVDGKTLKELAG
jgi:hypothetical protein